MNEQSRQLIRQHYATSREDSTGLFQTVLSISKKESMGEALDFLEQCVIERRLAWVEKNLGNLERTGDPIRDGYRIFYETYLGLSIPPDGEIVAANERRMVLRCWNRCPTLEACQKLGLDTREICQKVYHRPVQAFLSRVDPRLRFERNYAALRPYTPYCEEIIRLETPTPGPSGKAD